jgi:hypothetical protein
MDDQRRQKPSRHHSRAKVDTKTWKCIYSEVDIHERKACRKMIKARELAHDIPERRWASEKEKSK